MSVTQQVVPPQLTQGDVSDGGEPLSGKALADAIGEARLRRMWWEDGLEARSEAGLKAVVRSLPSLIREALRLAWRADKKGTAASIALTATSGLLSAIGLLSTQRVLLEIFDGGPTASRVAAALPALTLLALVTGLRASLGIAVGWAQTGMEPKVTLAAQRELFGVTTRVDVSAFDEDSFADDMERAMGRGLDASMALVRSSLALLAGLAGIVAVVAAVGVLHPLLIVVLLAAMVPTAWAAMRAGQQQYVAYLAGSLRRRQMFQLARLMADRKPAAELRAYTLRGFLLRQYDRVMLRETAKQVELARQLAHTNTVGALATGVASVGVYGVLAWLLLSGQIPLAVAATAVLALQAARQALRLVSFQMDQVYADGRHFRDLRNFITRARERISGPQPLAGGETTASLAPLEQLRLTGVTLSYPDRERPAVDGVDLTLRLGETIAFVGENGCGKSTLAAILSGLRRPSAGTVEWNGINTSTVDSAAVWARVAVVMQEHHHWPFTAAANIGLGDADREPLSDGIEHAARLAAAHDMIMELPKTYDTLLDRTFEGGQDISGGQWQRLVAARGFYRDADLLILDEPSSAVDALAEEELFKAVRDRSGKAATILITHRLANVRMADRIYVMEAGRIVAVGTHAELMAHEHSLYRRIFELQAAGYTDGIVSQAGAV